MPEKNEKVCFEDLDPEIQEAFIDLVVSILENKTQQQEQKQEV